MENSPRAADGAALRSRLGYITEAEVCALLDVKIATARNRPHSLPPSYKLGKTKLYKLSEVEAWIRRRRVQRTAA